MLICTFFNFWTVFKKETDNLNDINKYMEKMEYIYIYIYIIIIFTMNWYIYIIRLIIDN